MISITVQLPKTVFANKKWRDVIANAQRTKTVPELRNLFLKTVEGWEKRTDFSWKQTNSVSEIGIYMYPSGRFADIWKLVNQGSPAHTIYHKNGGILSFRPGYRAATTPGLLQSRRAYRSGPYVGAKRVNHPGFEGRKFTETIKQEFEPVFIKQMQEAVTEVARSH